MKLSGILLAINIVMLAFIWIFTAVETEPSIIFNGIIIQYIHQSAYLRYEGVLAF